MAPRKADVEEANDEKNKINSKEMVMDRKCTDVVCCMLFTVFIAAMIFVTVIGLMNGDPMRILTPFDNDGNECGKADQSKSTTLSSGRDFTEYKYKYFTGAMKAAAGDTSNQYDAICVKVCPTGLPDIEDFTTNPPAFLECMINDKVTTCPMPVYNATTIALFCVPEYTTTLATLKKLANAMAASG